MGTEIRLEVGGLTIDWSKNSRGADHGMLFQDIDRKRVHSDQIDYEYFQKSRENPAAMEMAFCRSLELMLPRLELLGFTLNEANIDYEETAELSRGIHTVVEGTDEVLDSDPMSFEEYCAFVARYPLEELNDRYLTGSETEDERKVIDRFKKSAANRLPYYPSGAVNVYSERRHFGEIVQIIHPYALLRVLALNEKNLKANVIWQYGPLVDAGWAEQEEFVGGSRRTQTFLIATEGSSDAHILKHAIAILKPEVADFFRFIDVSDGHPFSGAGNLVKFADGLAKIDVHNQVIFVFDNDAEGYSAYQRVMSLKMPSNMRAMLLPELDVLRQFPAEWPNGVSNVDINRRAAAIECYLDLEMNAELKATVVWSTYKQDLGEYQGALKKKESYVKRFLQQTAASIGKNGYDVSKLRIVLDALIGECCSIAEGALRLDTRAAITQLAQNRDC